MSETLPSNGPDRPATSPERGTGKGGGLARRAALRALRELRRHEGTLRDCIDAVGREHDLTPRDFALATELATGVMRRRLTLVHVVGRFARGGQPSGPVE